MPTRTGPVLKIRHVVLAMQRYRCKWKGFRSSEAHNLVSTELIRIEFGKDVSIFVVHVTAHDYWPK